MIGFWDDLVLDVIYEKRDRRVIRILCAISVMSNKKVQVMRVEQAKYMGLKSSS